MPISRSRAPVRRRISGHARSSTGRPLRVSWRPMKTTWCSRSSGSACSGIDDAVRDDLERRGEPALGRLGRHAARRRCARRCGRSGSPTTGMPSRIQPRSPAACQVATIGHCASASVATQIAGVIGSCRWTTSKRSSRSTSRTRRIARGERTMFGSEPFAGTTTERPTGMIAGRQVAVTAGARMQEARQQARRVVAHQDLHLVAARRAARRPGSRRARRPRPSTTTRTGRRSRSSCVRRRERGREPLDARARASRR